MVFLFIIYAYATYVFCCCTILIDILFSFFTLSRVEGCSELFSIVLRMFGYFLSPISFPFSPEKIHFRLLENLGGLY